MSESPSGPASPEATAGVAALSRADATDSTVEAREDAQRRESSPHRLFGLADGIFAISMTLLALEVKIGDDVPTDAAGYHSAARHFYGNFGIFILVFLITSRFWLIHHSMMARVTRVDRHVLERTIPFLAGISSLPVSTTLLFGYGSVPQAVAFASVVLALISLLLARIWWYITAPEHHLAEVDSDTRRDTMIDSLYSVVVYLLAIPIAFLLDGPPGQSHSAWATLVWTALLLDRQFIRLVNRLRNRLRRR